MKYFVRIKETGQVRDCTEDQDSYFNIIRQLTGMGSLQANATMRKGKLVTTDAEFWVEIPKADKAFQETIQKRRGGRPPMILGGGKFSPYRPASEETKQKQRESMLKRFHGANPKPTWSPCARCKDPDGKIVKPMVTPARFNAERFGYGAGSQICRTCYDWAMRREAKREGK